MADVRMLASTEKMAELDKYIFLPDEFKRSHDRCEFLIKQIEEFITNNAYDQLRIQSVQFSNKAKLKDEEHFFDYLQRLGETEERDKIVRNHLINALLIDVCYFVQEALACSKKKRLTVTFALLRKPFVYNLLVFLRLLFDEKFLKDFNEVEGFDTTSFDNSKKKDLIEKSISLLGLKHVSPDEIYDYIFNRSDDESLINLSDKALHLSTTRNKNNKTEIQNLNFIFSDYQSIMSQWDYLYRRLPFLLLYYVQIIEALIFNVIDVPEEEYINRIEERAKALK